MATLGPQNGSIKVYVKREGMAARVGHDLTLEARRWNADVKVEDGDLSACDITVSIDAGSLEVVAGSGGVNPLSEKDKADIQKNMSKVLQSDRSPEITFRATGCEASGNGRVTVNGELTIAGTTRPVRLDLSRQEGADGDHLSGRVTITQTQWGIKPYSGLMGALKVCDPVDIELDLHVPKS